MTYWHKLSKTRRRILRKERCVDESKISNEGKESKGAWWMPRLTEATKDVVSCEKPRVGANGL